GRPQKVDVLIAANRLVDFSFSSCCCNSPLTPPWGLERAIDPQDGVNAESCREQDTAMAHTVASATTEKSHIETAASGELWKIKADSVRLIVSSALQLHYGDALGVLLLAIAAHRQ